jgi:hypothetical protein
MTTPAIKVYALDDISWWAGESLEACVAAARATCGEDSYDDASLHREVSAEGMQRLLFTDEDGGTCRTFAEELQRRVDAGEPFPQHFAARDW